MELLSKLDPEYLTELNQIVVSGQLSAGQMSACKVLEPLQMLSKSLTLEVCQCLDYLLQSISQRRTCALVFTQLKIFRRRVLNFITQAVAEAGRGVFSHRVRRT